jgi:lipooligosaccharide transport system permease protein
MIESFKLSLSVVHRNWVVYKKDFLANISPSIADPLFIVLALGFGLGSFIPEINGLSYRNYLAPGLMATTVLFTAYFECSYGFYVRMAYENVFKAMLTTPIGVKEVILGEFMWVSLKGFVMALMVGLVLFCMGMIEHWDSLLYFPFIGALLALPCGAIGLLSSAFVRNINQFQIVYSFFISPIYFLSGVFFPLSINKNFELFMQSIPFTHGVKLLQMAAWYRFDVAEMFYHIGAIVVFTLILAFWSYQQITKKLTL